MTDNNIHIGQKIKHLMDQKGISAQKLSIRIEKTPSYIYYLLNKKDIDTALLRRISDALEIDIIYFFVPHGTEYNEYQIEKPKAVNSVELQGCEKQIELLNKIIADKEVIIKLQQEQLQKK